MFDSNLVLALVLLILALWFIGRFKTWRVVEIYTRESTDHFVYHTEEAVLDGPLVWVLFNVGMPVEGHATSEGEYLTKNGYVIKVLGDGILVTSPKGEVCEGTIEKAERGFFFLPRDDGTIYEPNYSFLTHADPEQLRKRYRHELHSA